MNSQHAVSIRITGILEKLNLTPIHQKDNILYYTSPFHENADALIEVDVSKNRWFDKITGEGGDSITFVCAYLKHQEVDYSEADAERWLENIILENTQGIKPISGLDAPSHNFRLVVKKKGEIKRPGLIWFLSDRGIPIDLANEWLSQYKLYNQDTKKYSYMAGLKNESGGVDLTSLFFSGCVGKRDVTFIRATLAENIDPKPDHVHIFQDVFDYLSALIRHNDSQPLKGDAIIINSLSLLPELTFFIKGYGYKTAYTWMKNDNLGRAALNSLDAFLKTEDTLAHIPMNELYKPKVSVNAWHMSLMGLTG